MTKHMTIRQIAKDLSIVLGLVLVWRGIWDFLNEIDKVFFDGVNIWTALIGGIVGLLILYLPDHDLKEIEKL